MDLQGVAQVGAWVNSQVKGKRLVRLYTQLTSAVAQNLQPGQARQPFSDQKNALTKALRLVEVDALTAEQIRFLERLEIADLVGPVGAERIERLFSDSGNDLAFAHQQLSNRTQLLTKGLERVEQVATQIAGLYEPSEPLPSGEFGFQLHFRGRASIGNAVSLKYWSDEIHAISRGFALVAGQAPEDVRVVGARKGSIIIELASGWLIVHLVGAATLRLLQIAKRVQEIRLKAEEIRALQLSNEVSIIELQSVKDRLEKIALSEQETRVLGVSDHLEKQFSLRIDGEQRNALTLSIRKLVHFIEKGGEIELLLPPQEVGGVEDEKLAQMRAEVAQLRKLAVEVRPLLETDSAKDAGTDSDGSELSGSGQ